MADSTTIGLGGYDPYRAKIEATKSLDAYSRAFTEPVQQFGTLLNVNNAADKARQIKQILAQPYILENGEIDYQQLGQDLMPLDTDLANKYLDLASAQVLKREKITSDEKIKQDILNTKKQSLSNKFDLSTEEGKLAWKDQFNKVQTAMYQPGFASADPTTVKEPMQNAATNLINQAQDYPELLSSVGLKPKEVKIDIDNIETPNILGPSHSSNISLIDSKLKDLKYKTDNTHDILSFVQQGNISKDERDALSAYVTDQMNLKPNKPGKELTDQQVIDKYAKDLGVGPLALANQKFNLFGAGINNIKTGTYGTAIQNFIKAANPGEAVMSDDINMANKGTITDGLKGLISKIGVDASGLNVKDIAEKLKSTAEISINNTIESLKSTGMTPEQIKLFIIQKLNGDFVLKNLGSEVVGKIKPDRKKIAGVWMLWNPQNGKWEKESK